MKIIKNENFITFLWIFFGFIAFTVIGTVSHEYGHIVVAKALGYKTTLHYGSMTYDDSALELDIAKLYNEKTKVEGSEVEAQLRMYKQKVDKYNRDKLWVRMGGPMQTCLTGILGLLLLQWRHRKRSISGLGFLDWLAVFLALFWLRQVFNFVVSIGSEMLNPKGSYFGGDEKVISELLNIPEGTVATFLGLIGFLVLIYIVFKVIPSRLRILFIGGGMLGGLVGFFLWMRVVGPIVLP